MQLSIAIPAYNHAAFITDTLLSIKNQQLKAYEIVVIDDHSQDETAEVVMACAQKYQLPIRLFKNTRNRGITYTISRAAGLASGRYLCFFNSDDVYLPHALQPLIDTLENNPNTAIVYGNGTYLHQGNLRGQMLQAQTNEFIKLKQGAEAMLFYIWTYPPRLFLQTALMRSDFFRSIGGFPDNALAEDWTLNIKIFEGLIKQKKAYVFLPDHITFAHRQHVANTSKQLLLQAFKSAYTVKHFTPLALRHLGLANTYLKRHHIYKAQGDVQNAQRFYRLYEKHKIRYEANPPNTITF